MELPPRNSQSADTRANAPGEAHLAWSVRTGAVDDVVRAMELRVATRRRRRRRFQAVAGLTAVLMLAGLVLQSPNPAREMQSAVAPVSTIVSVPERQVLPDGTIVELKHGARIRPMFTATARRLFLETGEAHFQVTKDLTRPFVVVAGDVEFRAVGTAFSVQLGGEAVELLVTEGRVAVDKFQQAKDPTTESNSPPSAATASAVTDDSQTLAVVDAGRRLTVSTRAETKHLTSPIETVPPAELGERLAWGGARPAN
jgi:transmembrane sensor